MGASKFTSEQIARFQWEVARGASMAAVARANGFSASAFARWAKKYGRPVVRKEPAPEDIARAREWRNAKTIVAAWRSLRAVLQDRPDDIDLYFPNDPAFAHNNSWLSVPEGARLLAAIDKPSLTNWLADPRERPAPRLVHAERVAFAWVHPLAAPD